VLGQADDSAQPVYLLYDGHGSVRQITDSDSGVINDFGFDAYGNLLYYTAAPQTALLYTGEFYDSVVRMQYLRNRWTDPSTGRFIRRDDYTGSRTDPLSLHKYIYCNDDPINNIDPTGYLTGTLTETTISLSISEQIGISLAATGLLVRQMYLQNDSILNRFLAEREIELFVQMQTATGTLTQQQFDELEERVRQKSRSRRKKKLYAHYSKKDMVTATSLILHGLWGADKLPPHGSFANPFPHIHFTGWDARWFNAMTYTPDGLYIVMPREGYGPTLGPRKVERNHGMGGRGTEVAFGKGSGGFGTVFGPIPIPEGEFRW